MRLWFRLPRGLPAALGGVILSWPWLTRGTLSLGLAGWLTRGSLLGRCLLAALPALSRRKIGRVSGSLNLTNTNPKFDMHDYHRAASSLGLPSVWPDTRPGWDRARPDYGSWLDNLRAERIQLLVVTRAEPTEGRHNVTDSEGLTIERVWADAHPEVFLPLYSDRVFRIYSLRPFEKMAKGSTEAAARSHS